MRKDEEPIGNRCNKDHPADCSGNGGMRDVGISDAFNGIDGVEAKHRAKDREHDDGTHGAGTATG